MDTQTALKTCLPLVDGKVKHANYDHVVKRTTMYYRPLVTGENVNHLVHRFNRRESESDHKQRMLLTQLITPSVCNTIMTPVRKVPKVRPQVNTATFGEQQKKQNEELSKALASFWGGKSVDDFIGSILLDQGEIDPNAFCLILFDNFDARFETAKVYPSLVGSEDAWNYEYAGGELQWLLVHRAIKYTIKAKAPKSGNITGKKPNDTSKDGHAFWWYDDTRQIMFTQVDPGTIAASIEGVLLGVNGQAVSATDAVDATGTTKYYYRVDPNELYEVTIYEHKAGMVQAFRLGYIPDHRTKGATAVSFIEPAMPYLLKGVKAGSELDLSAALHAFLQKIQYANPCRGFRNKNGAHIECVDGYEPTGNKKCRNCGGSGYDVHTTGQDHITLRMPRDKDDFLNLAELVHYVPLPVEVLQWQDGYVDKLERKCYAAVFNSDRFKPEATNTTATGDVIDLQSVYDALKPVCDWFSRTHITITKLTASFVVGSESLKTLQVNHTFPRNLRFESMADRVAMLKSMREAGVGGSGLVQVEEDLLEDIYVDDPDGLRKAKVQARFDPFRGKSEAAITSMISQDLTTKENKVLWTNFNQVFTECEWRAAQKKDESGEAVNFYAMEERLQREMVDQVIADMLVDIEEDAPTSAPRPTGDTKEEDDDTDEGGEGEGEEGEEDDLPESPGNRATR